MRYLAVKNWEKHQHYKDRSPPWIKLSKDVLADYEISCLQDASKAHLMLIWVLASQLNNKIPDDPMWVAKRIGATSKVNLNELIDKGFLYVLHDASIPIAKGSLEAETYREEADIPLDPPLQKMPFRDIPAEWEKFALDEIGWDMQIIADVWCQFRDYWQTGRGKSTKREDWAASWRTWCRKENIKPRNGGQNGPQNKSDRGKAAVMRGVGNFLTAQGQS